MKVLAGGLLSTDLHAAVVFCRRMNNSAALVKRMRERLFDVDILTGFTSHDHGDSVPMVRGGDDHCLDVLIVEESAKVLEALGLAIGKFESAVQIGYEGIGNGDGIDLAGSQKIFQVELTHSAGADQTDANAVGGSQDALSEWPSRSGNA